MPHELYSYCALPFHFYCVCHPTAFLVSIASPAQGMPISQSDLEIMLLKPASRLDRNMLLSVRHQDFVRHDSRQKSLLIVSIHPSPHCILSILRILYHCSGAKSSYILTPPPRTLHSSCFRTTCKANCISYHPSTRRPRSSDPTAIHLFSTPFNPLWTA